MLGYFFLKQKYINFIKNNFYFDYGLKFLAKAIAYNLLIQTAFFFAEKFIIEYFTRYSFNYSAIALNKVSLSLSHRYMILYLLMAAGNIILFLL